MTGLSSRVLDVVNKAAPTYGTVSIAERGLSQFIDPSMTGVCRFMQRSGYPFPLLTPQMGALLAEPATAGARSVVLKGTRLLPWVRLDSTVSFELYEEVRVTAAVATEEGNLRLLLGEPLAVAHDADTRVSLRRFLVFLQEDVPAGAGGIGSPAVKVLSPFALVPGDTIVIASKKYVLSRADETDADTLGRAYDLQVTNEAGLPELASDAVVEVLARPAYRSEILPMPHGVPNAIVGGPVAVDWVSGPMVSGYVPTPESEVYVEEFNAANTRLTAPYKVEKNDTLVRLPILREQMLFWRVADGGMNWNGSFAELRAFDSGRAHVWTPCRPPLNPAPVTTIARNVPVFAPYQVSLLSRLLASSVQVIDKTTKAAIPPSAYTVDAANGTLAFTSAHSGQQIVVTYQPQLEWQLLARPSVDNVELCVTVGREPKQVFTLGAAGSANTLTVRAMTGVAPDQLHVTVRRADDSPGPFAVELGDWQMRGGTLSAIRYTFATGADRDYDYAASGMCLKPLWPVLELLRAKLDGESLFARFLDNGRMLL